MFDMPITNPEKRRAYMRVYEEERRLGLLRSVPVGEVAVGMDEWREARAEYLRDWEVANRERRARQKREARRAARLAAEAGALRRLVGTETL